MEERYACCACPNLEVECRVLIRRSRRFEEADVVLVEEIATIDSGPNRVLTVVNLIFFLGIDQAVRHIGRDDFE